MRRIVILIAWAALFICACNREEAPVQKVAPAIYHLNIQASMAPQTKGVTFGGNGMTITSRFQEGDKIYLYNKTEDALARSAQDYSATPIVLTSSMIQDEGLSCTLAGEVSFFRWNPGESKGKEKTNSGEWVPVTHVSSDEYELYYQMNDADYSSEGNYYPGFNYHDQLGSKASASQHDFAVATGIQMNLVSGSLSAQNKVSFKNLQSIFRQGLIFKNSKSETVTPTITKLSVSCSKGTLVERIRPTEVDMYSAVYAFDIYNPVIVDGSIYLSLTFCYPNDDSKNDTFTLTATDNKGNVYTCEKNVPAGGFQNGKYYYGSCEMTWQEKNNLAAVEASDLGSIIASNGKIYADVASANIASKAEAKIVYVGSVDGVCEHGLAISLTDVYGYNATYAEATGIYIIPEWEAHHSISGGTWRLPSEKDWQYMMWGSYTDTPTTTQVNANLCSVLENDKYYWTSNSVNAEKAKAIYYNNSYASVWSLVKTEYYRVRACFAF